MIVPGLIAVRTGLAELDTAARQLLTGIDLGPDRWPGEEREIRAQHELAMRALGLAAVRLGTVEEMLGAKPGRAP